MLTELPVHNGAHATVALRLNETVYYPMEKEEQVDKRVTLLPKCEQAPVIRGDTAGVVTYFASGQPVAQVELVYGETVPLENGSILERFLRLFG